MHLLEIEADADTNYAKAILVYPLRHPNDMFAPAMLFRLKHEANGWTNVGAVVVVGPFG